MSILVERRKSYARLIREYLSHPGDPDEWAERFYREARTERWPLPFDPELADALIAIESDYDSLDPSARFDDEEQDIMCELTFRERLRENLRIIESRL